MKSTSSNPFGHYRKKPKVGRDVEDFSFIEIDGVKVLDKASNSTVTSILNLGHALEWELMQAMTYSQRSQKRLGHTVAPHVLREKFPTIDKFCDDDQVQEIVRSEPGTINTHKHAVHILSERLQINPATIDRYFRISTPKKIARNTKPVEARKTPRSTSGPKS